MDLLTIRELYKDQEKYLDQEITIGGCTFSQLIPVSFRKFTL